MDDMSLEEQDSSNDLIDITSMKALSHRMEHRRKDIPRSIPASQQFSD